VTARRTILSRFRRRPRPTDPEPYTRLDLLDGLPGRTRYDAEWPDVLAAEAPGGDLAAMAAPPDLYLGLDWRDVDVWPADQSDLSGWGEGYEIEPENAYMARHVMSDVAPVWVSWVAHRDARARAVGDMVHDLTTAMHAGSHLAITPTGCHLVGPLAHPPTPPVAEADVEDRLAEITARFAAAVSPEEGQEHETACASARDVRPLVAAVLAVLAECEGQTRASTARIRDVATAALGVTR